MKIKRHASLLIACLTLFLAAVGCDDVEELEDELTIDPVAEVYGEHVYGETPEVENELLGEPTVSDVHTIGEVDVD